MIDVFVNCDKAYVWNAFGKCSIIAHSTNLLL